MAEQVTLNGSLHLEDGKIILLCAEHPISGVGNSAAEASENLIKAFFTYMAATQWLEDKRFSRIPSLVAPEIQFRVDYEPVAAG